MANYYASARSNYFRVKDVDAFTEQAANYNLDVVPSETDPQVVAIFPGDYSDSGSWPTILFDEDTYDEIEIDLPQFVADHLAPGEVAYGLEVGAERLRYLNAYAWATNGTRTLTMDFEGAFRDAIAAEFGITDMGTVPTATY